MMKIYLDTFPVQRYVAKLAMMIYFVVKLILAANLLSRLTIVPPDVIFFSVPLTFWNMATNYFVVSLDLLFVSVSII
jgi:hypothetical protein